MNTKPVNRAEEFVLVVCQRSFLSLWCYNNPLGKDNDELCDILVVCAPSVIIVSVKEIQLKADDPSQVHHERWTRKAVEASVNQIYGAERWLASASRVIRGDGSLGLPLPRLVDRNVFRIAVAFGSQGEVGITSGDFGKGFVHVVTEDSFQDMLSELDTITDFVDYLAAKEAFAARCSVVLQGSETDLLGWYLHQGRTFPSDTTMMIVYDDIWAGLRERPEFKRQRKEADKESYTWDRLIDILSDPDAKPIGEFGAELNDLEVALRIMARETRFARRILGRAVCEFLQQATANILRSRVMVGPSGILYVIAYFSAGEDDRSRIAELGCRCLLARQKLGQGDTVIGIGIGKHIPGVGAPSDLIYIDTSRWSNADEKRALLMKEDLGYFAQAAMQPSHEEEYPAS